MYFGYKEAEQSTTHGALHRPMRTLFALVAILSVGGALRAPSAAAQPLTLEFESGPVWQSRNSAEVPNDGTATRFSLVDVTGRGTFFPVGRVYLTWHVSDSQEMRLLYAPLSVSGAGVVGRRLSFAGQTFDATAPLEGTYTFNSYRASYRWRTIQDSNFTGWLGFTAKIRDATIALQEGPTTSRKDDFGFVPLLHLAGTWAPSPSWSLGLDADGLAGGPGRAVDAALRVGFAPSKSWTLRFGYRTVEGGADVDEVYTFAWLHYAVASIAVRF